MRPVRTLPLLALGVVFLVLGAAGQARGGERAVSSGGQSACPARSTHPRLRRDPAARRRLVPGEPSRVVLCRYAAEPSLRLVRFRALPRPRRARHLAHRLNRLKGFPPGPINCPADDGRSIIARFRYRHAADDYVAVSLTGCREATNGPLTRSTSTRRLRTLRRLTR